MTTENESSKEINEGKNTQAGTPISPDHDNAGTTGEKASSAPKKRNRQRPVALLRERGVRFVNKMTNVGYLAGYCTPGKKNAFLLQQTNNIEQALHIDVGPRHQRVAQAVGRPVKVTVHARGYRDEHGPQLALQCIDVDRPSMLDLPMEDVWAAGFGKGVAASKTLKKLAKGSFSPFDDDGEIKPEFREFITKANEATGEYTLDSQVEEYVKAFRALGDILDASGGMIDSRLGRGQNYLRVAGFVDSRAWVPATEHRKGYALIMIRQHEDQEKNIPVRVSGKMANAYFKRATEGKPVLVEGSARRKVIPDDDGNVVSRHSFIEAKEIALAQMGQEILLPAPAWWYTIRDRLEARAKARQEQRREEQAQKDAEKERAAAELREDLEGTF